MENYGFDNYINVNGDGFFKVPFNNIDVNGHKFIVLILIILIYLIILLDILFLMKNLKKK